MHKWYQEAGEQNDVVISTRVRLARNLEGYPFPDKLSPAQAREIVRSCGKALSRLDDFKEYDIGSIPADEATYLLERHLISRDLIRRKNISSAFISSDGEVSVMVNEEDHLREQYILRGCDLYKAYERISGIDEGLGGEMKFAFDEKLGFLTACPSNVGTGMRASVISTTRSTSFTWSWMSRRVLAIWPGNHWIFGVCAILASFSRWGRSY